jgi:hypothetical protein
MGLPFARALGKPMKKRSTNVNGLSLQQALNQLIQTQADFVRDLSESRKTADRIRRDLDQIKAILLALPQALKREIGFKTR